jgi:hypothetical protein
LLSPLALPHLGQPLRPPLFQSHQKPPFLLLLLPKLLLLLRTKQPSQPVALLLVVVSCQATRHQRFLPFWRSAQLVLLVRYLSPVAAAHKRHYQSVQPGANLGY